MKNLPDEELFKDLEGRLQRYEEQPDDGAWDNIARQVPHDLPTWVKWADGSSLTITLLLLSLAVLGGRALSSKADRPMVSMEATSSADGVTEKELDTNGEEKSSGTQRNQITEGRPTVDSHPKLSSPENSSPERIDPTTVQGGLNNEQRKTDQASKANDHLPASSSASSDANIKNPTQKNTKKRDARSSVPAKAAEQGPARSQPTQDKIKTPRPGDNNSPPPIIQNKRRALNSAPLPKDRAPVSIALPPADLHEEPVRLASDSSTFMSVRSWINSDATIWYTSPAYAGNTGGSGGGNVSASGAGGSKTIVKPKPKQRRPTDLYFLVTPTLAYYSATATDDDAIYVRHRENLSTFSKTRRAFALEIGAQIAVYKRLSAIAGLTYYYQNLPITITRTGLDGSTSLPGTTGSIIVTPVDRQVEIDYRMSNIGITSGLLYTFSLRRFSHLAGASLQWELGLASGKTNYYENAGASYFSYRVLYRLEYSTTGSVRLFLQPSFTGPFSDEALLNNAIRVKSTRIGLGLGLIKEF